MYSIFALIIYGIKWVIWTYIFRAVYFAGMDPFGAGTIKRSWDDGSESLDNYKRRLHAAFEFFSKLGAHFKSKVLVSYEDFIVLTFL